MEQTSKGFGKIIQKHLLCSLAVYIAIFAVFSIWVSFEEKSRDVTVGGEVVFNDSRQFGPIFIEYLEFRGAGSGEFGGCARNIYAKDSERFLIAIDRGCTFSREGNILEISAGMLFYTFFLIPFVVIFSGILLAIGYKKTNPLFVHLGMLPIDFFVIVLLAALISTPVLYFKPITGRIGG